LNTLSLTVYHGLYTRDLPIKAMIKAFTLYQLTLSSKRPFHVVADFVFERSIAALFLVSTVSSVYSSFPFLASPFYEKLQK
jgi:hypothetical protein